MGMMIARRSRRRLGLNHLPKVAIGITEVKPLDARAWAIQVILHFVDLDALGFEVVVRRFNIGSRKVESHRARSHIPMHRRQSQRGASSWGFKSDPVLIALPVVCVDLKTQLLRVERFGLRHIGDCHHHHQNFFISHCHNLPFTCCKTACCVSFSRFSAVGKVKYSFSPTFVFQRCSAAFAPPGASLVSSESSTRPSRTICKSTPCSAA